MKARKILVRALVALMALVILVLAAAGTLVYATYRELLFVAEKNAPGDIGYLQTLGIAPVTLEPEQASYPKGVDQIVFRINNPDNLKYYAKYYYTITKKDYFLKVWPTRFKKFHTDKANDCNDDVGRIGFGSYSPSMPSDSVPDKTFTLRISDWWIRPTRGTYTYTTQIIVWVDGAAEVYTISCDFTIK